MKRHLLLFVALIVCCSAAPRARPDFGLVFNDDADLAFVLPDRSQSEALLRANVRALADTPVKTLVYCIGMGGDLLYYNTEVASRVGWRKSPDEAPGSLMEKRMENARVCLAQGADADGAQFQDFNLDDVKDILGKAGMDAVASSPSELSAIVTKDYPRWGAVIKRNGWILVGRRQS